MGPSDYRHNPFTDVSTAVQVTEVYRVPVVSPYTIQLNEVPVKSNPSTMAVKALNVSGTSISAGVAFTEVAANPAANQFFPDYNTAADGDENWNTGKLLFSSANAGGLVQITYQAKGTLASVRANRYPNHWVDRGDGSDGDFWPTSHVTISGIKNYKSVIIPAGITVSVAGWVHIKCQGECAIYGTLSAYGAASNEAPMTSASSMAGSAGGVGFFGGHSGGGGSAGAYSGGSGHWSFVQYPSIVADGSYVDLLFYKEALICCGAGGGSGGRTAGSENAGAGGSGGGCIRIISKTVSVSGQINASGANGAAGGSGAGGGGGGGGGIVVIIAEKIRWSSNIFVVGGSGGTAPSSATPGSAGSSGWIALKELGWS